MPFNKLKIYNKLLELDHLSENHREKSLVGIFERDFITSINTLNRRKIIPTPKDGQDTMSVLFAHLTTHTDDKKIKNRVYDRDRSIRIHWIKHHFLKHTQIEGVCIFSVKDKPAIRTYIYNKTESYVIILEPRIESIYYLITAYHLKGGNVKKIEQKMKRKLKEII